MLALVVDKPTTSPRLFIPKGDVSVPPSEPMSTHVPVPPLEMYVWRYPEPAVPVTATTCPGSLIRIALYGPRSTIGPFPE